MDFAFIYSDEFSIEHTSLSNDGKMLEVLIREVVFRGESFDSLEAEAGSNPQMLNTFTFSHGCLCNCSFDFVLPIAVDINGDERVGKLKCLLHLGKEIKNRSLDEEKLLLTLLVDDIELKSSGASGYFEDELLEIQKKLPVGVFIKACINCAYSDYSPYGSGLFGTMMCFRNLKEEYSQVKSKQDFWKVHDHFDRLVQEMHLCDDFFRRCAGTGYRG